MESLDLHDLLGVDLLSEDFIDPNGIESVELEGISEGLCEEINIMDDDDDDNIINTRPVPKQLEKHTRSLTEFTKITCSDAGDDDTVDIETVEEEIDLESLTHDGLSNSLQSLGGSSIESEESQVVEEVIETEIITDDFSIDMMTMADEDNFISANGIFLFDFKTYPFY